MSLKVVIAASLLVSSMASANAQHQGSVADQLACTPDVYRLCSAFIPDEDNIVSCLKQRKAQLSAGCKAVFSKPSPPKPSGDTGQNDDD